MNHKLQFQKGWSETHMSCKEKSMSKDISEKTTEKTHFMNCVKLRNYTGRLLMKPHSEFIKIFKEKKKSSCSYLYL